MGPEPRPGDESLGIRFTRTERAEFPASIVLADGFEWNGRIENRVVLLGGRYDRADVHRTPVGEMDGIDVVANIVETEMRGGGRRAPHLAKVIAIGMIELVVILLVFDHFSFFKALAVTVVGAAAFSWLLAVTGILPEWPYALFAMLLVVVNQFGIEVVRRQRQSLKDAFGALRRRLRPR
jgi:CHASE2 domain-containing sensor protein